MSYAYRVCTHLAPASFFQAAATSGVTLFEPFGGLCAGLEMALRNGFKVQAYIYSDIDPAARQVAAFRVQALAQRYPGQLATLALQDMFTQLPQDVRRITSLDLARATERNQGHWLVVAGWECQDLSTAGRCAGLDGPRSRTFWDLVRVLGALQQLQPLRPPAYLLENAPMQHNFRSPTVRQDFDRVCRTVGSPVLLDAAQLGARAHRLRNFWTNLACPAQLRLVLAGVVRPAGRWAAQVLGPGRSLRTCMRSDQPPFHPCNVAGQPPAALPTLVAYPLSRAFCPGRAGAVWDAAKQRWDEPSPDERELALGYTQRCTAAPGVTAAERHAITGRCMDATTLQHLLATAIALRQPDVAKLSAGGAATEPMAAAAVTQPPELRRRPVAPPSEEARRARQRSFPLRYLLRMGWQPGKGLGAQLQGIKGPILPAKLQRGAGLGSLQQAAPIALSPAVTRVIAAARQRHRQHRAASLLRRAPAAPSPPLPLGAVLAATEAEEPELFPAAEGKLQERRDIWSDSGSLHWLREGVHQPGLELQAQRRAERRARLYTAQGGGVLRRLADGSTRIVPPLAERQQLVKATHERCGHFGEKRTLSLLAASYWWRGMSNDVRLVLRSCETCSRITANFNALKPTLQVLPIQGMFYRWGVDLCGPFPESSSGHRYIMVGVEYYSKHIEAIPLFSKDSAETAAAFLQHVLARFGAMAEVVTDRGTEFQGDFQQLLEQCLVDHRLTAPGHPQADGLAERSVQSIKQALRKYCQQQDAIPGWHLHLQWVLLGYRCSVQAATGFSPYHMLYAQQPTVPPAVKERLQDPVDFDNPDTAAEALLQRAQVIRPLCLEAGENLRIAQHRDTLRYATVRGGGYLPKLRKFEVGDYVYLRAVPGENGERRDHTLQAEARQVILRVLEVRDSGAVLLQGKCGGIIRQNVINLAPCHLPNIDPTLDPSLARPDADLACEVCRYTENDNKMLLCDHCATGWHLYCLTPPLHAVPKGTWVCPRCSAAGITPAQVRANAQEAAKEAEAPTAPTKEGRPARLARQAAPLHGRQVRKAFREPDSRRRRLQLGTLEYLGNNAYPKQFKARFANGQEELMSLATASQVGPGSA